MGIEFAKALMWRLRPGIWKREGHKSLAWQGILPNHRLLFKPFGPHGLASLTNQKEVVNEYEKMDFIDAVASKFYIPLDGKSGSGRGQDRLGI